ncbi:MAG: HEPN domain-containing protein [Planctomycetes bacterium]|nr:HEPN domain-containing protein [Planctomycetota bacterium]
MKTIAAEWVAKAENDYLDAQRILRSRTRSDFSNSCFHSQQCAEKYMKAVLVEHGCGYKRVHDLPTLLNQLTAINPFWDALRQAANDLTDFAVRFRYPEGGTADRSAARAALAACKLIRVTLREHLGARASARRPIVPKTRRRKR